MGGMRRGTGILPVVFMARMAMPRLGLRLGRFALPAFDGPATAAPSTGPDDEPRRRPKCGHLCGTRWIPQPRVHPYPEQRFAARHPR
jgi:hypothetical protein